jgi:hypothetical protein
VHIAITPGRVAVANGKVFRDAAVEAPGWAGALKALGGVLAEGAWGGRAAITLSHHFAHVHCLPSPPVMLKPAEMPGWIHDYLDRHFGEMGRDWQLAWQGEAPGKPFLASSIAIPMLAELEEMSRSAGLRPGSIQPWFSAAWNRSYRRIGKGPAWFALIEPGRLMLASLSGGDVRRLRSISVQADAADALSDLLRREALLADTAPEAPVWVDSVLMRADLAAVRGGLDLRPLPSAGESLASMLGR